MKIIGITGPSGGGKTTALTALQTLGSTVIDCDEVYHRLLVTCQPMRQSLKLRFGDIFEQDGGLDRKKLGGVVFSDPSALMDLNAITHQYVLAEIDDEIAKAQEENRPAVAIDAIALIESGVGKKCDVTVAITAPIEVRIARIMAREGITKAYARKRVDAQKPDDFYQKSCDYLLVNDCATREEFSAKALALFEKII
ncbi:MAG: dephospho-CoA kinase [Oscillospiraceae bacterium]